MLISAKLHITDSMLISAKLHITGSMLISAKLQFTDSMLISAKLRIMDSMLFSAKLHRYIGSAFYRLHSLLIPLFQNCPLLLASLAPQIKKKWLIVKRRCKTASTTPLHFPGSQHLRIARCSWRLSHYTNEAKVAYC
jgi:hypothetical protein